MKNNSFLILGMLIVLLAFGLVLTGCDTGNEGGNGGGTPTAITGTWTGIGQNGNHLTLTIGNTDWECVNSNNYRFKGTYTYT
jgi:hypothetical protein